MDRVILDDDPQRELQRQNRILHSIMGQPAPLTNYLCHWSKRFKYVYVETPKAACTTIKRHLQEVEALTPLSRDRPGAVHDRDLSPLLAPRDDVDGFAEAMRGPDFFRFAFVRNPFTRALSCYLDKIVQTPYERKRLAPSLGLEVDPVPTFKEFLRAVSRQDDSERDIHWATQVHLLSPTMVDYSFIGRFEFFDQQFGVVCARLGLPDPTESPLDTRNATRAREKLMDFLGSDEITLIREIYASDFNSFGYGWAPEVA